MLEPQPLSSRARRIGLAAVLAVAFAPSVAAASAGSDLIDGAAPLGFSNPGAVNTFGFGLQVAEPIGGADAQCPVDEGATAWWRIAGTGQAITVSTEGSNYDTVLAVFNQGGGVPSTGNRFPCNNNNPDVAASVASKLAFPSTRGSTYLVQVGGRFAATGQVVLTATAPRPANDDRASTRVLESNVPVTVSNVGASQEPAEALSCGPAPFAATTWFQWTAPSIGDAVLSASAAFTDTVLTVYRAGDGAVVGCNDDAGQAGGPSQLALRVAPGESYLLQVGAKGVDGVATGQGNVTAAASFVPDPDVDNDGVLASSDCNDGDPAIRPGIAEVADDGIDQDCDGADAINLDRDGDGFNRPGDCNDADATIHPQAVDKPGNQVDEDCTGGAAKFPRLPSAVRSFFAFPPPRFTTLTVTSAVGGSQVELRCKGRGCFKRKVVKVTKSRKSLSLLRYVRKARLRAGAVVEIRITKSGNEGVVRRLTVRKAAKGKVPVKIEDLCLPVGASKPKSC